MSEFNYVGVDGEMTGNSISESALIQIGFAILDNKLDYFYQSINPEKPYIWSKEAEGVHGIREEMLKNFHRNEVVDGMSYKWLKDHGIVRNNISTNIAVGWNVGSFDLPFIKKYLPQTYSLFSFRSVDLNSICHALDGKNGKSMLEWKNLAKEYAKYMFEESEEMKAHHAGWDAIMAIYSFAFLRREISFL